VNPDVVEATDQEHASDPGAVAEVQPVPAPRVTALPTARFSTRVRYAVCFLAVAVPALLLYLRTLMPDLGFWDTGEFQAVGPVLGIAHPTGYPAYTLLLWLGSVVLQPFGNEAFRANLLSALLTAAACGLVAVTVAYLTRRFVIGIGVGIAFALAAQTWAIGLHADPHAFHLFLVAALLLLLVVWAERQRAGPPADRLLIAAAALFGVALANHALTLLLAPGIALYLLITYPAVVRRFRLVATCGAALAVTTVVLYAYLPIRAAMNPPLNYADPQTWSSFSYVVFGQQFTGTFMPRPALLDAINQVARYSWDQLGLVAVLALLGTLAGLVRRAALVLMLVAWFALTWYFALGYENADIGRYYLVPLMCVAILGGLGAGAILDAAKTLMARVAPARRSLARWAVAGLAGIVLIVPALVAVPVQFRNLDESRDHAARTWLDSLGAAMAQNAVIISWWSYSTPMWYGQYVEGWRPDVTIIDDRTILDDNLGTAMQVIDNNLGKRPVYLIRVPSDYPTYMQRYTMSNVPGIVDGVAVYQVTGFKPSALRTNP
jgi:hypothetical protein